MEVPERAIWARTLLAELNRVLNHLMFLGSYPLELGAITPIFYSFREREELQAVMEEASGGRMHYMFNRVGGLKEDLPAGWLGAGRRGDRGRAPAAARPREHDRRATRSCTPAPAGSACCTPGDDRGVRRLGADRPRVRGSTWTCAATSPTWPTPSCSTADGPGRVVTRTAGDCLARLEVLLEQTHVSLDLAEYCLDVLAALPQGPVNVKLPKVLRVPEGHLYTADREPARLQRLLPRLARGQDAVAAQAALGVVQQRLGAR